MIRAYEGEYRRLTAAPYVKAPGIVTGWPRLAVSEAEGRLGETHRRIFLARDGGSSRARRPERPGRKDHSYTYTYDNNSNLATKYDGTTTYTTTQVSSENLPDHLTDGTSTRHFTWTANGNMATDDRTFVGGGSMADTYGGRNMLESMTVNSQGITYKINAFGQRVSEAFSGNTTHYIHEIGNHVIAEADGSTGTTTMEFVLMEGELLAQIDGSGNIVYYTNTHYRSFYEVAPHSSGQ